MARSSKGSAAAFEFPLKGIDVCRPLAAQQKGTTPDCLNVVPFDPAAGRGRGGQRPGLSLLADYQTNSPVQLILECDSIQTQVNYVAGFTPTGANLENNLTYPAVNNTFAAFNAQEPAYWSAWGDNTNLGNAVYHLNTAAADPPTIGGGAQVQAGLSNGTGVPAQQFILAAPNVGASKNFLAVKRKGSSAPAGTWGPNYVVSVTFNQESGGCDSYVLAVADGSGGATTGNLAAGVKLRLDAQHLDFVTLTGSAAAVTLQTSDLVAQFNTLFPGVAGGPLAAPIAGNVGLVLYKQSSGSGIDFYLCRVTVTVGGTPYTWTVGPGSDPGQPYVMQGSAWGGVQDSICIAFDGGGNPGTNMWFAWGGIFAATPVWAVGPGYARSVHQLTVSGGNVYFGSPTAAGLVVGGAGIFTPGQLVSGAWGQGNGYLVDGTNTWKYTTGTNTVAAFTAAPAKGTLPAGCRIALIWRDRLILANQAGGNEQNIFASRQGDYTDWLVAQPDAQSAWGLNATGTAGHIGQPIMCFAPINDDLALVGTTGECFVMDGDPGSGGQVTLLSDEIGVMGQEAWDVSPKGILYFVGTGGLYRWHPAMRGFLGEKALDNLAEQTVAPLFQQIDRTLVNVSLRYDRDRHGCWILLAPRDGSQGTHYWWDERTEGFFKVQWPASMSPTFMEYLDGDTPATRFIMLGGIDGKVRSIDYAALSDNGIAINSHVYIGPKPLGGSPFTQMIVQQTEFWLGQEPAGAVNLNWQLQVGSDAVSSFAAGAASSGTFTTGGRQSKGLNRARGCYGTLYLSNATLNKGWTFEQVAMLLVDGGQNR